MTAIPPSVPAASADWLQGRAACREALRATLLALAPPAGTTTAAEPALPPPQQVWCIDRDFAAWPLDDVAVQQALADWLRHPGRRLQFIGLDFEKTALGLPRFGRWRRDHGHRIDAWRPTDGDLPPFLRGLLAGGTLWHWQESRDWQLHRITNPVHLAAFKADIADFLQRCAPAWPVTTLGL